MKDEDEVAWREPFHAAIGIGRKESLALIKSRPPANGLCVLARACLRWFLDALGFARRELASVHLRTVESLFGQFSVRGVMPIPI